MVRFNTATLEVKDLNEAMAITIMKQGLLNSKFIYSLDKTLPWSYIELFKRAQKYIHAEEGTTDRHQSEGKDQKKKMKKEGISAGPVEPVLRRRFHLSDQI